MRRIVAVFVVFFLLSSMTAIAASKQSDTYKGYSVVNVKVNDQEIRSDVPGINLDGTSLVPLRVIAESLGANVSWNESNSTAIITTEKDKPKTNSFSSAEYKIYKSIWNESNTIQNSIQQIQIAKDLYLVNQETREINNIVNIKIKKIKDDYKDVYNKFIDIQNLYPSNAEKVNELLSMLKALDSIIKSYEVSTDQLLKYTGASKDKSYLTNYYVYLGQANDGLSKLQDQLIKKLDSLEEANEK